MSETITLYAFGTNDRSAKVRWLAHELGLSIDEQRVVPGENRKPPYTTEINPQAKVPAVRFRGELFTESTAICHLIAEAHPESGLTIAPGEARRADFLFWCALFGESLEGRLVEALLGKVGVLPPEYFALHEKTARYTLKKAAERLPAEGYLCGRFTVADILAGYSLRTGVQAGLIARAAVEPYLTRLIERPAAARSEGFAGLPAA